MANELTTGTTCSSLIDRVKAIDQDAWTRLCQIYGPVVYKRVRRVGLQDGDAADIVQQVFTAVSSAVKEFDHSRSGATFRGWLWTITSNKLRDHFRNTRMQPQLIDGMDAWLDTRKTIDNSGDDREFQTEIVHRAMNLLQSEFEERSWRAFLRTAVDGAPVADVAADLGMSIGAVYVAKSRILKRLRLELDGLL